MTSKYLLLTSMVDTYVMRNAMDFGSPGNEGQNDKADFVKGRSTLPNPTPAPSPRPRPRPCPCPNPNPNPTPTPTPTHTHTPTPNSSPSPSPSPSPNPSKDHHGEQTRRSLGWLLYLSDDGLD